jgi:hypothetical protein
VTHTGTQTHREVLQARLATLRGRALAISLQLSDDYSTRFNEDVARGEMEISRIARQIAEIEAELEREEKR